MFQISTKHTIVTAQNLKSCIYNMSKIRQRKRKLYRQMRYSKMEFLKRELILVDISVRLEGSRHTQASRVGVVSAAHPVAVCWPRHTASPPMQVEELHGGVALVDGGAHQAELVEVLIAPRPALVRQQQAVNKLAIRTDS